MVKLRKISVQNLYMDISGGRNISYYKWRIVEVFYRDVPRGMAEDKSSGERL